jgi:hypothetical protein
MFSSSFLKAIIIEVVTSNEEKFCFKFFQENRNTIKTIEYSSNMIKENIITLGFLIC